MAALVGAQRDRMHIFLDRGVDDFGDRTIVTEVDDFGARGLQDAAHDIDRGIVPIEQAGRGDEANLAR